jgi:hypothetical protein
MSELLRTEIAEVLSRHRLVETRGWTRLSGIIEFECQCGEEFIVDPSDPFAKNRDELLDEHRARAIEELGIKRAPDHMDKAAMEELTSRMLRRRERALLAISSRGFGVRQDDILRLQGALDELNVLTDFLDRLARTRANNGHAELCALDFDRGALFDGHIQERLLA